MDIFTLGETELHLGDQRHLDENIEGFPHNLIRLYCEVGDMPQLLEGRPVTLPGE
jgi:hypothetical protein